MSKLRGEILRELGREANLVEALEMAIALEDESRAFYEAVSHQTRDEDLLSLYEFLSKEETKHSQYLQDFRRDMESGRTSETRWGFSQVIPIFSRQILREFSFQGEGEIPILVAALKLERRSEYLYEILSQRMVDDAHKEFFLQLADFERSHYDLLEGILEGISTIRMQI